MVAVLGTHLDGAVARELATQRQYILRMKLAGDEPIPRAQAGADQPWRAGIVPQLPARRAELAVVGGDRRQISRHRGRHAGARRRDQPRDAGLGLARAPGERAAEIVAARASMGVEHEQPLVLGRQQPQQLAEREVLQDVGKIAGMKAVTVVHGMAIAC